MKIRFVACDSCHWWSSKTGCENTNWKTGQLTDVHTPVCGYLLPTSTIPLSYKAIAKRVTEEDWKAGIYDKWKA